MDTNSSNVKDLILNFIVPIICITVTAILFFAIIYPSINKIPQIQQEITTKTATRNLLKDKIAKLHRFTDFRLVLEENSSLVNRVMPIEENVPGLLDQVNKIANESGLNLSKLSYSLTDVSAKEEQSANYSSVVISLGAEGNYSQMVAFMKEIENASRLVTISNYRFSANSNEKNLDTLSFTFVLTAPYLDVQSSAVTDEPLTLDITSSEFVSFINKVKGLRYFELSGDLTPLDFEVIKEENVEDVENTLESTPSAIIEVPGTGGGL